MTRRGDGSDLRFEGAEGTPTREAYHRGAGTVPPPSNHPFNDDGHGMCSDCGRREVLLDGSATHRKKARA